MLAFIFALLIHVHAGESINAALDSARAAYAANGERTTILIEPGTYQEELTIDIPGLTLKNAARKPSVALCNSGVDCDPQAVRITWYYGHGYQYKSMGETVNYGGSRSRRWNASVLVTAPDFTAENIIFENSFNLYVSEKEAADELDEIERKMPIRPRDVGSTEVQQSRFRERAAAISFTETATNAHLINCRAVGKQDVLYGDQGASVYWEKGILQGDVDFIFGAMRFCADRALIIANINRGNEHKCYISAGRSEGRGMLFYRCHIRMANEDELANQLMLPFLEPEAPQIYLARPWRYWGETVWAYTTWEEGILNPEGWSTGLVKAKPGYNPENPCPNSYEYKSQDQSVGRPAWVKILSSPRLPDGTKINPKQWML